MIHAIRKLAREVHRRSVWQVLGVYLLAGWLGLEAVRLLTRLVGLPWWTPSMAFALIVLGLPVTIATAVVQRGLPGLRIEDDVDPNELVGLTPEQVHRIPEAHPLHGVGVLTWRNAILMAVTSLALLVTSVVSYLTMWALGIGPVGSLQAQGAFRPADVVLVADFENRSDDFDLGPAVSSAFRASLARSGLLSVLDDDDVARALVGVGLDPGEPVTAALGRRLASAAGVAALVEGEITRVGGAYRVSAWIVLPPSTSPVARFRETARERVDLIPAIERLSERVRAKFGESLRVIRDGPTLAELVGPSLAP